MRAAGGALALFAVLAALVATGWTYGVDASVALAAGHLRGASPAWLVETTRDVTALGSNPVSGLLVLGAGAYALVIGRRAFAGWLLVNLVGALLLVGVIKTTVDRARPEVAGHAARVFTTSFPSSHATVSPALCAFFALSLSRGATGWERGLAIVAGTLLPLLVGLSRIYLGLHWPSDVVAGWLLGLGWACSCHAGLRWQANRPRARPMEAHRPPS